MGVVVNLSSNGVAGAFFARTQLAEWLPASLARQLPSRHRHIWVESGNNAARAGEDRWQGTCRDCLCRCQLTASGRDKGAAAVADHGCIDQDGHHFHGSLEGTGDEGQDCEGSAWCCKCGTRVHAVLQPPVLLPEAVQALEAARLAAHPHHPTQGARELVATVSTLYRIAKNASEGDQRPIKSDSEKPRRLLKFDAPCMRLLQALGFEQRGAELHPPLIVDSLSFDVPRRRLELARDELALLTARMLRKLPESERTASHGVTPLVYVGEALTRWLGVHAYARRQQSGLALLATAHGGAVDDAYRRLGVPEDAADALVAWAYRRQVEEDPETAGARAQRRYDSLAAICAARTSSGELLALVDSERDRGLVATASVRAACLALFGDSLLDVGGVDSDTIREVFLAKLADTYKTDAKMELAAHLAILACAKHDQGLEDYAANVKVNIEAQVTEKVNTWVQLPIGLANIGNTCYLNCMLQCLFSILPIRNAVLRFGDKKTWNEDVVPGRQDSGRLLDAAEIARALKFVALLKDLFESLVERRAEAWAATLAAKGTPSSGHPLLSASILGSPLLPVVTPDRELADMLLRIGNTHISNQQQRSVIQQQDVDECMAQCVSLLDHALPPNAENSSWIDRLLSGHLDLTLTAVSDDTGGDKVEPSPPPQRETFVNLNLNLPDMPSADINECIDGLFAPTTVTSNSRDLLRCSRIADAPPVLCLQVQRVQFDMSKMVAFKINSHLRLRKQVSLTRFTQFGHTADARLLDLQQRQTLIDQRLSTLSLPCAATTNKAAGESDVLTALDCAQSFMAGVCQWSQLDAAQSLLADLSQSPEATVQTAQTINDRLTALSTTLKDAKRQWTAEREETLGEISNIYESVTVDSMAYTLHAVFIHSGLTPEFGHYWVYIRDHDRVQRQVRWLKFNDSYVTVVDQAEIFRNAPAAGEESANPYYLVYVRSMELDDIVDLGI